MNDFLKSFSNIPISLFGSVMGLCGLSIAWHLAIELYNFPIFFYNILVIITFAVFILLFISYIIKIITNFKSFKNEFNNPVLKPFFGTFCISILLLPILISTFSQSLAFIIWMIGTILMIAFSLHVVSFWFCQKNDLVEITPAWIIPVVGNLDVPLALDFINYNNNFINNVGLFSLSVGLFFTIPIFTLIIYRVLFHSKLSDKLTPTLMILVAPFAVGFSAYYQFFAMDFFTSLLFYVGLFMFFTLIPILKNASQCCPFKVTWWAISFPIASLLVASLKYANFYNEIYFDILSILFLILFSIAIFLLLFKTIFEIFIGNLGKLI